MGDDLISCVSWRHSDRRRIANAWQIKRCIKLRLPSRVLVVDDSATTRASLIARR